MNRILTAALIAFACCLPFSGCVKRENVPADNILLSTDVDTVVHEVNSFTDELERAVESAQEPRAGVDAAQRLLDERRPVLAARIASVKSGS